MTHETRTVTVTAYRCDRGHPTCLRGWPDRACAFLSTRHYGTAYHCAATGDEPRRGRPAGEPAQHMAADWLEPLRPGDGCPVWGEVVL